MDKYHEDTPPTKLKSAVMGGKKTKLHKAEIELNKIKSEVDQSFEERIKDLDPTPKAFERWWWREGSGAPRQDENHEEFTYRTARVAWMNGADKKEGHIGISDPLTDLAQTAYLFAARYTHNRNTGGTLAITHALAMVWDKLSDQIKKQIEDEAMNEATENRDDWAQFFHWDDSKPHWKD